MVHHISHLCLLVFHRRLVAPTVVLSRYLTSRGSGHVSLFAHTSL
jgi:hypothetical protein